MANKISVIIDVATDKAVASLKSFRSSIAEADGASGKLKAGWVGATDAIKANAGTLAMSAGTALVAFGVKSVQAFNDTALAAGKFSDATGIAVDDASRWMEVGGDVGIGADAIQGAIQKMNKALADGKPAFEEYGVEVVRTSDGMVDANATFQNALTTIGGIVDPTKRAQAAQQIFGKSYAEVAELMEMSAGDLEAALKGVSEQKVIDERELRRAREFRAAMDTLKDRLEDVTLEVGGALTPVLTDLATAIDDVDSAANSLTGGDGGLVGIVRTAYEVIPGLKSIFNGLAAIKSLLGQDITATFEGDLTAADAAANELGDTLDGETTPAVDTLRSSTDRAKRAAEDLEEAWSNLKGEVDDDQAFLNIQDTFADVESKGIEAWTANVEGAVDAEEKTRDYQQAINDAKQDVIDYGREVLGLPPSKVTELLLLLDEGRVAEVNQQLAILTRNRTISVELVKKGAIGWDVYVDPNGNRINARASGGPVRAGEPYIVGEEGPELVVPATSGTVIPAGQTAAMLSGAGSPVGMAAPTVNNYFTIHALNPTELVDAINRATRLGYTINGLTP